jgi:hypothetical protein
VQGRGMGNGRVEVIGPYRHRRSPSSCILPSTPSRHTPL